MRLHDIKFSLALTAVLLFVGGVVWAQSAAQPSLTTLPPNFNRNAMRGCLYQSGGWTTIDSDNSVGNLSGAHTAWTTYVIQCDDDAYIAWGGATAAADSSDGWIASGAWLRYITDASNIYVSVLNKTNATADCHYIECK